MTNPIEGIYASHTPTNNPIDSIERRLNNGWSVDKIVSNFTGHTVAGGFITSGIKVLHDGPRSKTFVSAFHIPNKNDNTIHHFKVDFRKVIRQDQNSPWTHAEFMSINEPDALVGLVEFIKEQTTLVGIEINNNALYQAITIKGSVSAEEIQQFVKDAMTGDKTVVEKTILASLKEQRASDEQIAIYEDDLTEFRRLIADTDTSETDMQNFLKGHVWFFGLDYIQGHLHSKPKFSSGLGSEYDFLLEGFNQVYDIAELKGPNDSLLDLRSSSSRGGAFDPRNDYKYSNSFARALHQVICYMDEFENQFDLIQTGQPSIKNFMYPKAMVVISKRSLFPEIGRNSTKYLHLLNRQFSNIEALTYDDLAERAQNIINFMKTSNQVEPVNE